MKELKALKGKEKNITSNFMPKNLLIWLTGTDFSKDKTNLARDNLY